MNGDENGGVWDERKNSAWIDGDSACFDVLAFKGKVHLQDYR